MKKGKPPWMSDELWASYQANKKKNGTLDPKPKNTVNYETLIEGIKSLGVSFSFDMFSGRAMVVGLGDGYDGEISDKAIGCLWRMLVMAEIRNVPGSQRLTEICMDLAYQNRFHPVLDWLNGLEWDGICRVEGWLGRYVGSEDTELNRAVGSLWMQAAVRRIKWPGCKFDHVLILQGKTGLGKSGACRILAHNDSWFSDCFPSFDDERKQLEALAGKWIIEYPDLAGMRTAEGEKIKAFVSRQEDRARPAYGRLLVSQPRQCVFVGTTEEAQCLNDVTNRRFWPVACGEIDLGGLREVVEQLWAEAVVLEERSEPLTLHESLWLDQENVAGMARRLPPYAEAIARIVGEGDGAFACTRLREWLDIPLSSWNSCCWAVGKSIRMLRFRRVQLGCEAHGASRGEWVYARGEFSDIRQLPTIRHVRAQL
jgi:hypothetical protein